MEFVVADLSLENYISLRKPQRFEYVSNNS